MKNRYFMLGVSLLSAAIALPSTVQAADSRRIEEVVVTAERRESSVQDTSISITAFTSDMLDDFGIRNQSDLQNMVPATTIQPYDSAVRGVGRNFRNLGGDPGVATYMNGIYSEDLYTATIGSFWDVDRIEVLRGPQGTLYGRNAVGGAMNFLYKKPSNEFELSLKTVLGDYDTRDIYGVVNAPIIDGVLAARLTGSIRQHDGWVKEMSGLGPDLDSGDEQNFALSLEWNVSDNMTLNIRQNKASVDRVMGGAAGAGLVVLAGEFPGGTTRDNTNLITGLRAIDPTQVDPTESDFDMRNFVPGTETFTFTNPTTGATILAQRDRIGVDSSNTKLNASSATTYGNTACVFTDKENIDGGDLCAFTNGLNNETFDQQGTQLEFSWDVSDSLTLKYLFGYNDLMYQRTTDDDNSASLVYDSQFYVNHEAEYVSHEFQAFWDVSDTLSFTTGIFFYDSTIDQRYDFYSSTSQSNISDPAYSTDTVLRDFTAFLNSGAAGLPAGCCPPGSVVPGDPPLGALWYAANDRNDDGVPDFLPGGDVLPSGYVDVNSARRAAEIYGDPVGAVTMVLSPWGGEATLGSIPHGPVTPGSDTHVLNKTEREAKAAYTQGVWNITDQFTLTFGVRWAEDDVKGFEDLAQWGESGVFWADPDPLDPTSTGGPFFGTLDLLTVNVFRGAISSTTLQPTGLVDPWVGGVPVVAGLHRKLARTDDDVTYRVNLDWDITDDMMIYGNVTTGYRSGGFNLAFFSQTPQYEPESLAAYELGMKGQFIDNTLQLNASIYLYDYESIHTATTEACPVSEPPGGWQSACILASNTTSVQAAGGAEVTGFELEALWLATENVTLGGNFSLTDSEYTESFIVTDGADPTVRGDIYTSQNQADRARDIKGHRLLQVPDSKFSAFGSYRVPMSSGDIDILANYSWIDDVWFSAFESELDKAPAYGRLDLRATWTSTGENWIIGAFVNNVTDEIGIREILRHGSSDGFRRTAQVTEPRVYGVEITYNLN
jgi:outer membrane receptor protein involved in Fe transport